MAASAVLISPTSHAINTNNNNNTTNDDNNNTNTTTTTHQRTVRPLPQGVKDNGNRYTLAQRIQCLTLLAEGFPTADIERKTGVKERSQRYIRKKAFERGFRPEQDPRILESYVADGERSGRPKKAAAVVAAVSGDGADGGGDGVER